MSSLYYAFAFYYAFGFFLSESNNLSNYESEIWVFSGDTWLSEK
jgi:hypothetical protein